jgi:hypothetical protein
LLDSSELRDRLPALSIGHLTVPLANEEGVQAKPERFPSQNPNRRSAIPIPAATQKPGSVTNVRENSLGVRIAVHSGTPTKIQTKATRMNLRYDAMKQHSEA